MPDNDRDFLISLFYTLVNQFNVDPDQDYMYRLSVIINHIPKDQKTGWTYVPPNQRKTDEIKEKYKIRF